MKAIKYRVGVVLILTTLTLTSLIPLNAAQSHKKPLRSLRKETWQDRLKKELEELERFYPGQVGLFIKDLNTGEEFSLNGEENWYLASTIKIPVAIEVLRQVDAKKLSLDQKIQLTPDDFVDGNGPVQFLKSGSKVSIGYLIEQMIVWSDNIATDMLLRIVGVSSVNALIKTLSPSGFQEITTLKDVRRHVYGELHKSAFTLSGQNFMQLRRISDPVEKINKLTELLRLDPKDMKVPGIHEAYQNYYRKGLNSASLRSYSRILETLWEGKVLTPDSQKFLVQTMLKTQTGKKRIRAGLKSPLVFAHKTGTQYERIGDVGYIWNPEAPHKKPLVVVSFVRNIPEQKVSSKVLEKVAQILSNSGAL